MDLIKSEKNSIDINYLREDLAIHIEQSFDNEIFFIHFKTVSIRHKTLSSILFF
jgi:hypothetical protein